jgi:von Willebrand factor type A domain
MRALIPAAVAIVASIVVGALAIRHWWMNAEPAHGLLRRMIGFAGGPFPLSVALHVAVLLFLIITVHESRGRELLLVNLEAGGGGGGGNELADLDLPELPMPDMPQRMDQPQAVDTTQSVALASDYVRAAGGGGIGIGRGGGMGTGYGRGLGPGFGGFIADLRRKGLDVVLVIDGTDSMAMIMSDVKARMRQLIAAIHNLVPTARIGIVVYGGQADPIDVLPLTMLPAKADAFLASIKPMGGDQWEENVDGALAAAVNRMDWKPYAKKVIVLVGDAPPKPAKFARVMELASGFRSRNGVINTVDVSAQEHERFERAFYMKVHNTEPRAISPLPAFYQQTRAAYEVIARASGGEMKSLQPDDRVSREVLVLAFGSKWRSEIARFVRK